MRNPPGRVCAQTGARRAFHAKYVGKKKGMIVDDRSLILKTLEQRVPLFNTWPRPEVVRIGGDECELANLDQCGNADAEFHRLPVITANGGRIYKDMGHVEFCTPETSNPVARTAYIEAMKRYCFRERYAHKLYCHSVDGCGNTFGGSHENWFTCAFRRDWPRLIPFLIARTLIAGSGNWIKLNGTPTYEISQRARFIVSDVSEDTTCNRGIINTRPEPLSEVKGWDRMHVIYSEPTMCEVATFLKIGLMSLVVELMEIHALPSIKYDQEKAVSDLHRISLKMGGWFLDGVTKGPKGAAELLGCYVARARELFWGRDEVTNAVIVVAEDTLERLALNPMKFLFGRLDWVTKYEVLRLVLEEFPDHIKDEFEWLRSQDMEWHNLNPADGLYYGLRQTRQVERIVSDELIAEAMEEPPADTRAFVRGKTQQLLKMEGRGRELHNCAWEDLWVVDAKVNRYGEKLIIGEPPRVYWKELIPNPFDPGRELLERIKARIAAGE